MDAPLPMLIKVKHHPLDLATRRRGGRDPTICQLRDEKRFCFAGEVGGEPVGREEFEGEVGGGDDLSGEGRRVSE